MAEVASPNINRVWADLLVEELIRAGVGLFCLAPGSRSTPLTTAVAANPRARHVMHFDERGTAFCALGYGRATRRPAAWITTSGTAVANGFPAVVEAAVDGVPLLLVTADRPPELRDTGANQTIDQVKIFGDFVRWQFDLPSPDRTVDPAFVLTTADQAAYRARRAPAGPVHLNVMFREPLAPDPDGGDYAEYLGRVSGWMERDRPYTRYAAGSAAPAATDLAPLAVRMQQARRGLVVAGRLETRAQADAVRWLADRLGWPLLPDACSQLRLGGDAPPDHPAYHYDLLLAGDAFAKAVHPDAVLYFGSRSTSKRLHQALARARPPLYAVIRERPDRMDPLHRVTDFVEADIVTTCRDLAERAEDESDEAVRSRRSEWARLWSEASHAADRVIERELGCEMGREPAGGLSEPLLARLLTRRAPEGSGFVAASSMPVRDVDTYGAADGRAPFAAANRGASGIDGTVATAVGLARGLGREVTLLIGDLALLHDLNSLAMVRTSPHPIVTVVVNNRGGGIFSFLPIARHTDVFEPFFGTPHEFEFEKAAEMFGLPHARPASVNELLATYDRAIEKRQSCIIEVATDRTENVELHRKLEAMVAREAIV